MTDSVWILAERVAVVCAGLWANAAAAFERDDWAESHRLHGMAQHGFTALRTGDPGQMSKALKLMEHLP